MGKRYVIILLCWLGLHPLVKAQEDLNFNRISILNGLPHNTVFCIVQDTYGFMWFGTRYGLARYDGDSFITFNSLNSGLKNHTVRDLVPKNDSVYFLATEGGLYLLNIRSQKIQPYKTAIGFIPARIVDLEKDDRGQLWVCTEGEGIYAVVNDKVKHYKEPEQVSSIICGSNGQVYACSPGNKAGLFTLDQGADHFSLIAGASFSPMCGIRDQEGTIWIGTQGGGIYKMSEGGKPLPAITLGASRNINIIRSLLVIDDKLYAATEGGLVIINKKDGAQHHYTYNAANPNGIADNALYSICRDYEGGIWIGSYFRGISYMRNEKLPFESFSGKLNGGFSFGAAISSFFQINKDKILVASEDNGVSIFNPQTASFSTFPFNSLISYNNVHDIALDDNGHLWLGTYLHGVDVIDLSRKHKTRIVNNGGQGIHSNSILRLLKDKRGNIHIGTVLGASMYNITDHTINRMEITHDAVIRDMLEDSKGNIWYISMNKGVFKYQPVTGRWAVFNTETSNIPTNKIVCARQDEKGTVWLGTEGFGLLKFVQRTGRFEQANKEAGLPDNYIFSIECADNYLWIGTTNGFYRYNPVTGSVKSYSEEDGLTDRYFNYNSSRKMANGDLYFGTVNGFFRFNPWQVKRQTKLPPVYITGLKVSDRNHNKITENLDFDALSSGEQEFTFPFSQNNIKIDFTALSYTQSSKMVYRYMLEGFETKWNTWHNKRSVEYGNLSPGNYIFTLQVSNGDDIWLKHPLQLHLVIKKPYWQTGLAWAVYSVLLVLLFVFSVRYIKRKEKAKYNRKEEIRKQEMASAQINFFTNLTHEIKTPLSLLKVPIEVFKEDKEFPEKHQQVLAIMDKNAAWLENLVDELLGFQKIAEQQYQVNPVRTDVTLLLQNLAERFNGYATKNSITFKFISSFPGPVMADIDARAMVKAVSNLMVNGFKYTRTRLILTLRPDKGTLGYKIAVHDNGYGIKKEQISRVFEPFAQLEPVKKMKGVGIGLAYTRSLVELQRGRVELRSSEGHWCVATIYLPKRIDAVADTGAQPGTINYDDLIPSLPFIGTESLSEHSWEISNESGPAHILVVEDTVEIAYNLVTFLKPRYQVGYCKNGADALEYVSKFQPDIIVSDIIMPEMDGVALCRNIKANALTSHIQVILLTAKTTDNDRLLGLEVGANAYINKPFLLKEVELTVKNLLQLRTALRDRLLQGAASDDPAPANQLSEYDKAFINKVAVIVEENLDNIDFKTDDFAEKLGMSKTLVYIKLKKLLNMAPNEYLLNIRFNKAKELLLRDRDLTIAEVAYEVGFSEPNYFSRAFKQHVGQTPSAFRNKRSSSQ